MTTEIDRLLKRFTKRRKENDKLFEDIFRLFLIIEERGQMIDNLATKYASAIECIDIILKTLEPDDRILDDFLKSIKRRRDVLEGKDE